jgi:hypothetical protein
MQLSLVGSRAIGILSLAVAIIVLAPKSGSAAGCPGGGKIRNDIPVTTIIGDVDANGLPAIISSDGLGSYRHGVDGASSILTHNGYNCIKHGDWQFDILGSTFRTAGHTFAEADAVQPGDPNYTAPANPPFWGTELLASRVTVKCTLIKKSMLTMAAGSTMTCPLINRFVVGNIDFHLNAAKSFDGFPEVTDAQIRCNTADSGGCNDWSIDPINLGQAVGRLVPTGTGINDGDFYMRFHIHVTRP